MFNLHPESAPMSIKIMTAVWEHAPYTEGTLLVLLALADWANDEGECWPSGPMIAAKSRLSESGAKYSLKKLVEDGAIEKIVTGNGKGNRSRYQIRGEYLSPLKNRIKGSVETSKGSVNEPKGVSKRDCNKEEPSLEPSIEPPASESASQTSGEGDSEKKNSKKAKGEKDQVIATRFTEFVEDLDKYWKWKVKGDVPFLFTPADASLLKQFVKNNSQISREHWRTILRNRGMSDEVVHTQALRSWIRMATEYLSGPLNKFGKPKNPTRSAPPVNTGPPPVPEWKQQLIDENNRKFRLGLLEPDEIEKFRKAGTLTADGEPT